MVAEQTRDEVETEEALAKLQIVQGRKTATWPSWNWHAQPRCLNQHTITSPIEVHVVVERSSRRVNIR